MKMTRLAAVSEIIKDTPVSTQEELLSLLRDRGYDVTQATVSRDIKALRLSKVTDASGRARYALPAQKASSDQLDKLRMIFKESVIGVATAGNIVVIKCYAGMGNAACAALDAMNLEHIVGTIAGDDTIFAAVDTVEYAFTLVGKLNQLL